MGSSLQQILQGRGDKKGKGLWLKVAPVFFLAAAWGGLLFEIPARFPQIWFPFMAATLFACGILHGRAKRDAYSVEFLYAVILFYYGIVDITGIPWLKLACFPFLVAMTKFYSFSVITSVSVLVPFNEVRTFTIKQGNMEWEVFYSIFLILTSVTASLIFATLRKDRIKTEEELSKIRASARDKTEDIEMASLGSNEIISHHLASKIKTDEELQELLNVIKQALYADSAHFFEPHGDTFVPRCSTEPKGSMIVTGRGIMEKCFRDQKPYFSSDFSEKKSELGYIKNSTVRSLMIIPVMEGSTSVGILAADTSRLDAFNEPEQKMILLFPDQIARILERERIYNILKHDITALRMIKEFSSSLAASIHYDVVINKLCDYAAQTFEGNTVFIENNNHKLILKYSSGGMAAGSGDFDFRGTIVSLAAENHHMEYISDSRNFGMKIFPDQLLAKPFISVIAVPLFYEGEHLGVFCMVSQEREFLDSRQISLLEVMCNQAATSMANAKMHSEIEKMASTDGLTGLFNHRVFQQKLTDEIKRSARQSAPLSLLLTDIDFFKKVNDTYGHPVGDVVLKGVSKILKNAIRDIDTAARYGGEEFAVILPGTDGAGAKVFAERLRKAVMNETFLADGKTLKVTTSIGIASIPHDASGKEELIEKADQALYQAKHNGRNQSVNWKKGQS